MIELVKFTCPDCGKEWTEEQDTEDYWFGLATQNTLCEDCAKIWLHNLFREEETNAST